MKALGIEGEDLAVKFLKKIGYKIVAKNYKTQIGEVDIIARDGDTTVFIEVKTRTNNSFGYPFEAVHKVKRRQVKMSCLPRRFPYRAKRFSSIGVACSC